MHDLILRSYFAVSSKVNCLQGTDQRDLCETNLPVIGATGDNIQIALQLLFGILAVIAVIIITLAGIRYITESTNPQETAKARNTIIYAAVGLTIAISGQVIVSFVLSRAK